MTKPIINIDELEFLPRPAALAPTGEAAARFDARMAYVGTRVGARQLGYNVTAIPPGKWAFPFHSHRVNEEMFFVLQGSGEIRIGNTAYPLRDGDVISCLAGGKETAHQIINTGTEELRYLAVSTKQSPDLCEYPDSGKFGVLAEFPAEGIRQAAAIPFCRPGWRELGLLRGKPIASAAKWGQAGDLPCN